MSKKAVNDLISQYQRSFKMIREEIERFSPEQWVRGLPSQRDPVRLAIHIFDLLDFCFSGKILEEYTWGHRFGGGWGGPPDEELPDQTALLAYAQEIEDRVVAHLSALEYADLSKPFELVDWGGGTHLGHYINALRHAIHHHGQLATLSVYHGNEGGSWY